MCGRFVINIPLDEFLKHFGLKSAPDWPARYNVAPTQLVPVIREIADGTPQLTTMRWGLLPAWAKDVGDGLINARCETAHEKPSFRHSLRQRRCIIPASGFYEWMHQGGQKVPYYIRMADGSPMPFAGLWEAWRSPEGKILETCAILTTTANATVSPIHDRMPVVLHPDEFCLWLDRQVYEPEKLSSLFSPYPADKLTAYPISTLVNNPANDSPECIAPIRD